MLNSCIYCRHAFWPTHSAGECLSPTAPPDTTTASAREKDGYCGHEAKFWEEKNS